MDAVTSSLLSGDRQALLDMLNEQLAASVWHTACHAIISGGFVPDSPVATQNLFVEAGHRIREQIADDDLLIKLMRQLLPKYCGEGVHLYRGENVARFRQNQVGLCWSTDRSIAELFGSGLNAALEGGLLLSAFAPPEAILATPSNHSRYLGEEEYWIDPTGLVDLQIIAEYPVFK